MDDPLLNLETLSPSKLLEYCKDEVLKPRICEYLRTLTPTFFDYYSIDCYVHPKCNLPMVSLCTDCNVHSRRCELCFHGIEAIDELEAIGVPYGIIVRNEVPMNAKSFTTLVFTNYDHEITNIWPNVHTLYIKTYTSLTPSDTFSNIVSLSYKGRVEQLDLSRYNNLRKFMIDISLHDRYDICDYSDLRVDEFAIASMCTYGSVRAPIAASSIDSYRVDIVNLALCRVINLIINSVRASTVNTALSLRQLQHLYIYIERRVYNEYHVKTAPAEIKQHVNNCSREYCDCPLRSLSNYLLSFRIYNCIHFKLSINNPTLQHLKIDWCNDVDINCNQLKYLSLYTNGVVNINSYSLEELIINRIEKCSIYTPNLKKLKVKHAIFSKRALNIYAPNLEYLNVVSVRNHKINEYFPFIKYMEYKSYERFVDFTPYRYLETLKIVTDIPTVIVASNVKLELHGARIRNLITI